jgi:hypothetical protein
MFCITMVNSHYIGGAQNPGNRLPWHLILYSVTLYFVPSVCDLLHVILEVAPRFLGNLCTTALNIYFGVCSVDWFDLAHDKGQLWAVVNTATESQFA